MMFQVERQRASWPVAALRWARRTVLMTFLPPLVLLALVPAIGTVLGWFFEVPPLPSYGVLFQAALESPGKVFHVMWGLYLQLAALIALVVIPFTVGRASFWKPFNRWMDRKVEHGLTALPPSARKPAMAVLGASMLCLLAWLVATASM